MRKELPKEISQEMKLWRIGLGVIPKAYIEFHKNRALETIKELEAQGFKFHGNLVMKSDGWFDGMRLLNAILETPDGDLYKIVWNDSNQEFFVKHKHGGSSPLRLELKR